MARVHAERFLKELDTLLKKYNARIVQDEYQEYINVLVVGHHEYEISRMLGVGEPEIVNNLTPPKASSKTEPTTTNNK